MGPMHFGLKPALLSVFLLSGTAEAVKYEIRVLQIRPAAEYAAHQDFQNLAIGAYVCHTDERVDEVFDTDKMIERGYLPVLIVIDNQNEFPVEIVQGDIYLVGPDGEEVSTVAYQDVLLALSLDKPLSSYSTPKEILLYRSVDKEMILDFEHKSFGRKLIAPVSSDHGVVFFPLPDVDRLEAYRLYFPEVIDFSTGESLMFFEFNLKVTEQ